MDNSSCCFSRYAINYVKDHRTMPVSDFVLVLKVWDQEFELLSNMELVKILNKAELMGAQHCYIEGETHRYLKQLTNVLPLFKTILPVIVSVDDCRTFFLERIIPYVDGVNLQVRMPLRKVYRKQDKSFFREIGEYRPPEKYKRTVSDMINKIMSLKYASIQVNTDLIRGQDLKDTLSFLEEFNTRIVVR